MYNFIWNKYIFFNLKKDIWFYHLFYYVGPKYVGGFHPQAYVPKKKNKLGEFFSLGISLVVRESVNK